MANDFAANEDRAVRTEKVGREENPVIVIDDYMANPDTMVDFASSTANFTAPNNWYPGLRAQPLPQEYVIEVIRALHGIIAETFDLPAKGDVNANTYFGLATVSPQNLSTLQCLPHFDTSNPRQIALLHYLCEESYGGTSFFRHRSSGYESIGADRERSYFAALERELAAGGPPPARYMSGDDDRFEETARFDAKFNRMIVYRSLVLHSGNVNPAAGLSRDPRRGRLTANVFLAYR
jgi:hypothetical protein